MEFSATPEIIISLKKKKVEKNLSVSDIYSMIREAGESVSKTTLRRVFADKSETEDSFSYEATIRPIVRVLMFHDGLTSDDMSDAVKDKIESFMDIITIKNEELAQLRQQYEARCREYEKRMAFLRDQIELKDQRMDRKDALIEKLMAKVL